MMSRSQNKEAHTDVLELGVALVLARRRLKQRIQLLSPDLDEVGTLTRATIAAAWNSRDHCPTGADVDTWLVEMLHRKVLN